MTKLGTLRARRSAVHCATPARALVERLTERRRARRVPSSASRRDATSCATAAAMRVVVRSTIGASAAATSCSSDRGCRCMRPPVRPTPVPLYPTRSGNGEGSLDRYHARRPVLVLLRARGRRAAGTPASATGARRQASAPATSAGNAPQRIHEPVPPIEEPLLVRASGALRLGSVCAGGRPVTAGSAFPWGAYGSPLSLARETAPAPVRASARVRVHTIP
jgi:hypothetical protein